MFLFIFVEKSRGSHFTQTSSKLSWRIELKDFSILLCNHWYSWGKAAWTKAGAMFPGSSQSFSFQCLQCFYPGFTIFQGIIPHKSDCSAGVEKREFLFRTRNWVIRGINSLSLRHGWPVAAKAGGSLVSPDLLSQSTLKDRLKSLIYVLAYGWARGKAWVNRRAEHQRDKIELL